MLSRGQRAVLETLATNGTLRIGGLAKTLGCSPQNASKLVFRLAAIGHVEIVLFEKRRGWRAARITELGRRAIGETDATVAARYEEILRVLSDREKRALDRILAKVRVGERASGDPGAEQVLTVTPRATVVVDPAEVAKRTPEDPAEARRRLGEKLKARAQKYRWEDLLWFERAIWDSEIAGVPAHPEEYATFRTMRSVGAGTMTLDPLGEVSDGSGGTP